MTDTRFRILLILFIGLLVAAVWALPYWWPILNQESVAAEVFPGLSLDARADFILLPGSERQAYFALLAGDEEEEIDPQPEWALRLVEARLFETDRFAAGVDTPFVAPEAAFVIATGIFEGVDSILQAQGDLTIYQTPTDQRLLRLEDNFKSSRAPGIHIVLTRNADPMDENGIGVDYIDLGALHGNVGGQSYDVPASLDFREYVILALYAPAYDAVLGTATLR